MVRILRKRGELPQIIDQVVGTFDEQSTHPVHHLGDTPLPSQHAVIEILEKLRAVIFPGFIGREHVSRGSLRYYIGELIYEIHELLSDEIFKAWQSCSEEDEEARCHEKAEEVSLTFIRRIPDLRHLLMLDAAAAFRGDPAAKSVDEILFSYPGMKAICIHRIAHEIYKLKIPLIPRIMGEYAHKETGIDIHPGATIGESFFIDHGTGVVIGETTDIGANVTVYQGVTLGALSFKEGAAKMRGMKRHPTIQDNVVIYAGATILGGETVIGHDSVIGGNVWVINSVPPQTKVMMELPKLKIRVND